ncbi:MAG: hypothetical protein ACOC3W_06085 [Thermodesulfobacteriota bacterium]
MNKVTVKKIVFLLISLWVFQGCGGDSDDSVHGDNLKESGLKMAELIDDRYSKATAGEPGWEYAVTTAVDLDKDGESETLVLVANVSLYNGRPAWNDGQAWQAYVVESGGERIDLYRQYIQLGKVSLAISENAENGPGTVLLAENTDTHIRMIEIHYRGPDEIRATELLSRHLIASPKPMPPPEYKQPVHLDPISGKT